MITMFSFGYSAFSRFPSARPFIPPGISTSRKATSSGDAFASRSASSGLFAPRCVPPGSSLPMILSISFTINSRSSTINVYMVYLLFFTGIRMTARVPVASDEICKLPLHNASSRFRVLSMPMPRLSF